MVVRFNAILKWIRELLTLSTDTVYSGTINKTVPALCRFPDSTSIKARYWWLSFPSQQVYSGAGHLYFALHNTSLYLSNYILSASQPSRNGQALHCRSCRNGLIRCQHYGAASVRMFLQSFSLRGAEIYQFPATTTFGTSILMPGLVPPRLLVSLLPLGLPLPLLLTPEMFTMYLS